MKQLGGVPWKIRSDDETDRSQEFEEFAAIIMTELGLQPPCDVNEALNMYLTLIKEVEKLP